MKIVALSICIKDTIHAAASHLVNFVICERGKSRKHSVNYKEDDLFQLENEKMSCDNMFVDYSKVKEFYDERNEIDVKMKGDSLTLLP